MDLIFNSTLLRLEIKLILLSRSRGQIPSTQEVPTAQNNLGWRTKDTLLQGTHA